MSQYDSLCYQWAIAQLRTREAANIASGLWRGRWGVYSLQLEIRQCWLNKAAKSSDCVFLIRPFRFSHQHPFSPSRAFDTLPQREAAFSKGHAEGHAQTYYFPLQVYHKSGMQQGFVDLMQQCLACDDVQPSNPQWSAGLAISSIEGTVVVNQDIYPVF